MGDPINVSNPLHHSVSVVPTELKPINPTNHEATKSPPPSDGSDSYVSPSSPRSMPPLVSDRLQNILTTRLWLECAPDVQNPYTARTLDRRIALSLEMALTKNISLELTGARDKFIGPQPTGIYSETESSFSGGVKGTF